MNNQEVAFISGFGLGLFVAWVIGFMSNKILKARNDMRAPDRPMNVPTGKTPRNVMASAAEAAQTCMVWSFALVLFLVLVVAVLFSLFGL